MISALVFHSFLTCQFYTLTMVESVGKMYALATVLGLLAIVATALRFYARRIKQASLSWDDYMILPALVCCDALEVSVKCSKLRD